MEYYRPLSYMSPSVWAAWIEIRLPLWEYCQIPVAVRMGGVD